MNRHKGHYNIKRAQGAEGPTLGADLSGAASVSFASLGTIIEFLHLTTFVWEAKYGNVLLYQMTDYGSRFG